MAFLSSSGADLSDTPGRMLLNLWNQEKLSLKMRDLKMNKEKIEERKKYLALQAFYLGIKQLVEELEKKLNPKMIKPNKQENDL